MDEQKILEIAREMGAVDAGADFLEIPFAGAIRASWLVELANAILAAQAESAEPVAWLDTKTNEVTVKATMGSFFGGMCGTNIEPLYPHPQPQSANVAELVEALKFYADGHHFIKSDDSAWDTVSGEPQNFWCDEAGTATVEDGSVARAALAKHGGK